MLDFIFCIHIHQPVGNFDHVVRDAFRRSYLPFLKTLKKFPEIKVSLHLSGILIDWMKEHEKRYMDMLSLMVEKGQIELMCAGYYEPILVTIPEHDRIGQINLMKDKLKKTFGITPRGLWVTERVWEPHLPETLSKAGIEYAVVDDYHFIKSGLRYEDLSGYYITEEGGLSVNVFPGSEKLRYLIPFESVKTIEGYLRGILEGAHKSAHASKGSGNAVSKDKMGNLVVFADDGEKFGLWPGTYDYVYGEGWLKDFFGFLKKNSGWLRSVTFSQYLKENEPVGRAYLPVASYREMEEWALPAEASSAFTSLYKRVKDWRDGQEIVRFLKGGFWRNFLSKYPESNRMHKRMLMVSRRVHELAEREKRSAAVSLKDMNNLGHGPTLNEAAQLLYKAQCNDAYWHGVFGGLYLPHLRSAVYSSLIEAENILDGCLSLGKRLETHTEIHAELHTTLSSPSGCDVKEAQAPPLVRRVKEDFNCDGYDEVRLTSPALDLFISPQKGGAIFELDCREKAYNLLNLLSRHVEGYHSRIKTHGGNGDKEGYAMSIHDAIHIKEEGIERFLIYDDYSRGMFHDRFLSNDVTPEDLMCGGFKELGGFVSGAYSILEDDKNDMEGCKTSAGASAQPITVKLLRDAHVSGKKVRIEKAFCIDRNEAEMYVEYSITNLEDKTVECNFAPEINILLGFNGLKKPCDHGDIKVFKLHEDWLGLSFSLAFSHKARLFTYPVETVSLSEGGAERIFQGICILPVHKAILKPNRPLIIKYKVDIKGQAVDFKSGF